MTKMVMFFLVSAMFIIISFTIMLIIIISKGNKIDNSKGKNIIQKFEPDNMSQKLTDMIEYHRKNGIIDYEIDA